MEREPTRLQQNKIELDLNKPTGNFDFKGFRVHYNLDTKTQDDMNAEYPADFAVTQDSHGGGESLSIWIWEGVPQKFKEVLLHHELIEADLKLNQGLPQKEAHKTAFDSHMQYAKEYLSQEGYDEFIQWQNKIKFHD